MMFRSLALASDALVMQGQSMFEAYEDRVVMRTPDEPDYWHGNLIIMKHPPGDALAQVSQFQTDFPDATHRTIIWDVPDLDPAPLAATLTPHGYEVGTSDTLALGDKIQDVRRPEGIILRTLNSDADWTALTDLQAEVALEEGYDPKLHTPFLQRRNTARRKQIADWMGAWFGAFDGSILVGSMGMFHDDRIARYQAVETRASHRRRGICAALLVQAAKWALGRAPKARPVIVAEAKSDAGRLYRRMGFRLAETLVEATKPGY